MYLNNVYDGKALKKQIQYVSFIECFQQLFIIYLFISYLTVIYLLFIIYHLFIC